MLKKLEFYLDYIVLALFIRYFIISPKIIDKVAIVIFAVILLLHSLVKYNYSKRTKGFKEKVIMKFTFVAYHLAYFALFLALILDMVYNQTHLLLSVAFVFIQIFHSIFSAYYDDKYLIFQGLLIPLENIKSVELLNENRIVVKYKKSEEKRYVFRLKSVAKKLSEILLEKVKK